MVLYFAMGKRSPLNRTLLPSGYFDPKVRVVLMVTMNGSPTVLMDGVITRQEVTPSNEPGQSTLTVTGEDLTVVMDLCLKIEHARYVGRMHWLGFNTRRITSVRTGLQ